MVNASAPKSSHLPVGVADSVGRPAALKNCKQETAAHGQRTRHIFAKPVTPYSYPGLLRLRRLLTVGDDLEQSLMLVDQLEKAEPACTSST